jgi:hypothetical protein
MKKRSAQGFSAFDTAETAADSKHGVPASAAWTWRGGREYFFTNSSATVCNLLSPAQRDSTYLWSGHGIHTSRTILVSTDYRHVDEKIFGALRGDISAIG